MSNLYQATGLKVALEKIWIPDLSEPSSKIEDSVFRDSVSDVRRIPMDSQEIAVPDPKAMRSMSRASLFLSSMAVEIKEVLAPFLAQSPFSVGIYCAVENGPIDGPSTAEILNRSSETFDFVYAEAYRKLRNPKMYLKQLPNLVPAQLGISLGIQGPMNVYTHSVYACQQALEQAEWDLCSGAVEAALVLSAHAFDDFWVVKRTRLQDERVLCEGAAVQILRRAEQFDKGLAMNEIKKRVKKNYYLDSQNYFGISDPLINLIRRGN